VYIAFLFVLLHIWYSRFYNRESSRNLSIVLVVVCSLSLFAYYRFFFFHCILTASCSSISSHIYCLFLRMIALYAPCGHLFSLILSFCCRVGLVANRIFSNRMVYLFFLCVYSSFARMYVCVYVVMFHQCAKTHEECESSKNRRKKITIFMFRRLSVDSKKLFLSFSSVDGLNTMFEAY